MELKEEVDRMLMEIQRSKFTERRTETRQAFVRPVKVHLPNGPTIQSFSKDLSSQGIGLICDVSFQPGSIAILEIHSTMSYPVCVRSEVRWCDSYGKGWYLIGWKFITTEARPMTRT